MGAIDPLNPPTLPEYRAMVPDDKEHCRWDGAKLPQHVESYPHEGGWYVKTDDGTVDKAWLFIKCPKCGYDWSFNKLGVPRA